MTSYLRMNSAQGILSMLEDKDPVIQVYALRKLDMVIDIAWPEAATYLSLLEELSSNKDFEESSLAALVTSKVFYHL